MKVIFLDVDGVLNTSQTFVARCKVWEKTGIWISKFDEFRIKMLSEIVIETGTKIVLSATMRDEFIKENNKIIANSDDSKDLESLFKKYGISIYDITPIVNRYRQVEIKKWLEEHHDIDSFVILDDDSVDLTDFIGKELIKTNFFSEGLSEIHKKEILRKLMGEDLYMKLKLEEILLSDEIIKSINNNIDYLLTIIPEIKDMINFPHNHPHHHLDVWYHTLLALSLSQPDLEIRLCLLLHDIGKPHSYQDEEIRHFKGHAKESSNISRNILKRLRNNEQFIENICYLIEKHDTPIKEEDIISNYDLEYKRFKIQYCDAMAHHPDKLEKRKKYLENIENKFNELKTNYVYFKK